jgi:RHO1 GDP-GTP exchange protein 1/2
MSDPPQRSFSSASTVVHELPNGTSAKGDAQPGGHKLIHQRRTPLVYPAMLSRVALAFRQRVNLTNISKDILEYSNAFSGEEAVTTIAYIIKTTDRNLALLLGRSLDAQKFFHEVTYSHRLRDLRSEVYQFRERDALVEDKPEVNGVFTLLTECYSPTCTRDRLCYSIACPRRLEQQARLKLRLQPGLQSADSHTSLHDETNDEQKLWINTVSKEIAASVSDKEKKRQEVISELAYTERDFVKDIEYMRDFWMKPLRSPRSPVRDNRRDPFVRTVFSNISEIYGVNKILAEALTKRQQEHPVVYKVGDIFLESVLKFSPFITYGAAQLMGKYEYENERKSNPMFAKFVEDTERLKESRKLELNGYLTKPTTRLARYPLLLENIHKYTADDNPDKQDIPRAIKFIREVLTKVNAESGKAENRFTLLSLSRELYFRPGEEVDLKLEDEKRQLIFRGMLKRTPSEQQGDIQAYLFDHALLLVRIKTVNKKEDLKVFKKPIPLELLVVAEMHEVLQPKGVDRRPSSSLMGSRTGTMTSQSSKDKDKQPVYPLTFKALGRGGYDLTLYCSTQIQQQKFIEHIDAQQRVQRNSVKVFTETIISQGFFAAANRVNCCAPIDGGLKLLLGTEAGLYLLDRKPRDASAKPRRVLDCKGVTQIEVLETHSILLVLTEKTVYSYPMDALDPKNTNDESFRKGGRKICHANFFKAGISQGQQLVCCVKTSALSTTLKVYEPMDTITKKSKKGGLAKILASSQDVLKPLKVSRPLFPI